MFESLISKFACISDFNAYFGTESSVSVSVCPTYTLLVLFVSFRDSGDKYSDY